MGSVDNTSDANKPISTATQTALNAKAGLTTTNTFTGANTFTGVNGLRVDGTGNGRLSLLNDGVRRALLSSSGEVVSLVAYQSDGGTSTGQLDIGTGGMKYWGSATVTGTLTASNLSGTNSGDQDLSGLAPLSNPRLSSSVPVGADVADTAAARANAPGVQGAGGVGSGGTILFGNGATNWGYIKGYFTNGTSNGTGRIIIGTRTSVTDTAMTAKITVNESGATTFASTVTAANLSGTNTGDQTSVSGNAGTATKLQTPRAISGVTFDGSAPITIPYSGLSGLPTLGTAASKDSGDFASSTTYGGGDLNTLLTSGVYRLNNNVTNGPTGSLYGQLLVLHGGSDTQAQQYFPYASSDVYTRGGSSSGATWQPWVKHWHSGNLDPASFATAAQGAKADAALPAANLSGFTKFAVVTALPGSPDPNTIYFVK